MKCVASKNYQELTSVLPCMYLFGITVIQTTWFIPNYFLVSVTEVLEHWIRNEKDVMLQSSSDSSNATSWMTTYFLTLHSYYFLRYVYCNIIFEIKAPCMDYPFSEMPSYWSIPLQ